MPTPSKPANVIKMEKKSHRTKREIAAREQEEKELLTGKVIRETKETKEDELAHKEFRRLVKLLGSIGKNDDLYGATINRYCLLQAECIRFQQEQESIRVQVEQLEDNYSSFAAQDDLKSYFSLLVNMQKNLTALDKQLQAKRKMLLDIEKENIMTIAASLRSIPKDPKKKKNLLREALASGD